MAKTVAEAMSRAPITVHPETSITEVIKILADKRISGLPVLDDDQHLIGIISETDLMWRETDVTPPAYIMLLDSVIYLENPGRYEKELHKALGQTVGEVMSAVPVTTTTPETPLSKAAKLMHDRKVHRLPVIDQSGHLVGILTRGDIIRTMAAEQTE
ncbi:MULTISPECIES: CBS domain-containing protein [Leptolyngbya]|jgi:CBS domain-containing protein|uniref:Signal transduction protein n=2 Tax=Leptolyngbya boryana TaxID=1184 RepID=A0A1Z4JDZ6_LEPBY|nr:MULTISPECIES: CBS domain-containing protein [Leptolyngbya]BAY54951.1 signal transduction protein [Leptolyngbya boryana NIES-2135]MBD1854260.1 CBS domain-containing protein [Leptolyngbya sp. FACHB-1624]MBD2365930.1 CBS domain-containing protein [Leptolyngbya sp. FACHB-161]MBD2372110.1 CBS domain-containing protein [Leptolyngbya sp. FACHB-238]MBD2396534.1 CBS domain-containing protein [Leptolyngbya sp. FACHB-239]